MKKSITIIALILATFMELSFAKVCGLCQFTCVCNDGKTFPQEKAQTPNFWSGKCSTNPSDWAWFCKDCGTHGGLKTYKDINCPN